MTGRQVEIVVVGTVAPVAARGLGDLEVVANESGRTRMRGWVADGAALHGLLDSLYAAGLDLWAVRCLD